MSYTYYHFFKKLSNPLRIAIITQLRKEKTVSQLSKNLNEEQSKVSHALKELHNCNIVKMRKKGKERFYSLSKTIVPILKMIDRHSKEACRFCIYKK